MCKLLNGTLPVSGGEDATALSLNECHYCRVLGFEVIGTFHQIQQSQSRQNRLQLLLHFYVEGKMVTPLLHC